MMGRTIDKCKEIGDVDLAILLDTDGDRCGVVLKGDSPNTFEEINRNRLIAFLSHIVCKGDNNATPKIVTDSVTSIGEILRGTKRRADNVSVRNEIHTRLYLHTRRTPSPTTAIILTHHPSHFCDSLRSS